MRETLEKLMRYDVRHVALAAFVVGVFLHVCIVYAVLDDGGGVSPARSGGSGGDAPASQQATPTPTRPPDRTSCTEIRGTDYRSDTEREWFLRNCGGGAIAPFREPATG